jgi:N4-(beta-N-acetylglucosaminyl)-L-asparaginase
MAVKPVMITTWKFGVEACKVGFEVLKAGGSALEAVERAANVTEEDPEVSSVGYGGLPNAEGVVELDAAIMDGNGHSAGAVAAMTGIRKPISVARLVMERTPHVLLAGHNARRFALQNGFTEAELLTDAARKRWKAWLQERIAPDVAHFDEAGKRDTRCERSHDTIGLCALDCFGNLAAGCTTSGLFGKMPGRVGDSPIIGSGLYVDNEVGASAATGNGDEMMKVCLSYRVVMQMERGMPPQEACEEAIRYLLRKRPRHQQHGAACIALSRNGEIGAAATREGFHPPNRAWIYAVSHQEGVLVCEGVYVDP